MDLDDWRLKINELDASLIHLLNERAKCALAIGEIKREIGQPIYDPVREAWILDKVAEKNPGPLEPDAIKRLFERIIDESRRLERRLSGEGAAPTE
jgi:chorismate mutase